MNVWTRTLEDDVAKLHDLDTQGDAAAKVVDIEDELVNIVCLSWCTMLSGYLLMIRSH